MARIPVAIIMGSQSDWETMRHAAETLAALEVDCEKRIVSAHRTPDKVLAYLDRAHREGVQVLIGCAGVAAHLAQLVEHQKSVLLIADGQRRRQRDVGAGKALQAQHGLLEQAAVVSRQDQELLRVARTRQRPQAGA